MSFCMSHTFQSRLEMDQEAKIIEVDLSAAFDRVNHQGILFKPCLVSVGGSVLSFLTQFISNRSKYVVVDCCQSKLVNVVSWVLKEVVWARSCSSYTPRTFYIYWRIIFTVLLTILLGLLLCHHLVRAQLLQNSCIVILTELVNGVTFKEWNGMRRVRLRLCHSLHVWCLAQFIPVNPILVPVNPYPATVLKESDDLVDNFDAKMTFEKHVPSVSRVADQRIGIIRKSCMAIISWLIAPFLNDNR